MATLLQNEPLLNQVELLRTAPTFQDDDNFFIIEKAYDDLVNGLELDDDIKSLLQEALEKYIPDSN